MRASAVQLLAGLVAAAAGVGAGEPGFAPSAPSEPSVPAGFTRLELRPVEQGAADINPVATSLRWQPTDLRVPVKFDRVFRLSDVVDTRSAPQLPYRSDNVRPHARQR